MHKEESTKDSKRHAIQLVGVNPVKGMGWGGGGRETHRGYGDGGAVQPAQGTVSRKARGALGGRGRTGGSTWYRVQLPTPPPPCCMPGSHMNECWPSAVT